jgi:AcrR family transcriptional regulator
MKVIRRHYRMAARAESAAETGKRIVRAMQELFAEQPYPDITVAEIAERAQVTVQTVLRRFGSKEAVLVAAAEEGRARVVAERGAAPTGNRPAAVQNLLDHYERWGAIALRLLEQEERIPGIRTIAQEARDVHARWVERVFEPDLGRLRPRTRERRRAQLIALTDVYVWKLLRRDLGIPRAAVEELVLELVDAVCAAGGG